MNDKITVLISDDNKEFANTLSSYLDKDDAIQVVGMAKDRRRSNRNDSIYKT